MDDSSPDPDRRVAILDAATDLFARHGIAATSIKTIAQAADVNPALIYYYFADKAALYQAVLDRLILEVPTRLFAAVADASSPRAGLAAIVRGQAELFLALPALPRMIARELADHEARHATTVLGDQAQRLLTLITGLIREGQQRGDFRTDVEPELAAVSIIAQVNWFCIAGPVVEQVLGRSGVARDPATVRQFAEHAVRFSLTGLEPARGGT
jgi:AcrR family transcriptional regulator